MSTAQSPDEPKSNGRISPADEGLACYWCDRTTYKCDVTLCKICMNLFCDRCAADCNYSCRDQDYMCEGCHYEQCSELAKEGDSESESSCYIEDYCDESSEESDANAKVETEVNEVKTV